MDSLFDNSITELATLFGLADEIASDEADYQAYLDGLSSEDDLVDYVEAMENDLYELPTTKELKPGSLDWACAQLRRIEKETNIE